MDPNFQHMGGPGQMMPQQQQQRQQQQQQQQRPPQNQNATAQIQNMIFSTLQQQTGNLTGWRAQVLANERMGLIFNIIGNLRLASQHQPNPPTLQRMIEIGIRFEKDIFDKSPNKETYKHEVQLKLEQLLERRHQNQASLQQAINQQAQAQAQAQAQQAQAQQQQMVMNQGNMQGQVPRPMPQQPAQQGFSHLQHQMQASPLPGQQPQQAPMGMQNQGPPQNMPQNQQQQQQQFQIPMAQSQQPQPQQNRPPPNGQPQLSQQDNNLVVDLTTRLLSQATEDEKNTLRTSLQARMDPQQFQKYQAQGMDPVFLYFRNQALNRLRQEKAQRLQAQQLALSQQNQNLTPAAPAMLQQRSMNPSPANGQTQVPTSVGGNPDFGSFMGNMENLAQQQQHQGVLAQEAGQMVVPASGAPRNGTPQPGVMAGQGMDMNDQRGVANPNSRAQHQQQLFNAQQIQQQRMQHAAQQQQQQSQARLNAQQKAQIGLRGQPGGMGPGPVPPQQSPAMATLNAPLRTPSGQMNHPETPQVNPNAQFGQPLDPRFMQGNQRQPGPGNGMPGLNPAMFPGMGPEAQRALATMPPEKLNDVVAKWHESRAGQMGAANVPGGRPQVPMQGAGQVRPGQQIPQPGQFNQQNALNQFMMANPGQRPPQSMTGGMNQQQQMILQQQMANLRQNQMQQRNIPQNMAQMEQRTVSQMDNVDIPQLFANHASMPQGAPGEIKKWGQLKQWVAQNPNLGPNSLEGVKQLQRMHYAQAMRGRAQQQGQPAGNQPGAQGPQGGMPTAAPGMAAPVAPMGPNSMQMPNGMNMPGPGQLRQPSQQEIQNMRNHSSGKLAAATDDQIRTLFMRNQAAQIQAQAQAQAQAQNQGQLTPQQQQQRQQMMALQMSRMAQVNGQQPHPPGQPQPNPNVMGPNSAKPTQVPQTKQPQPAADQAAPVTNTGRPAPRSQPNGRNQAQNSSPAQPPKNLKRASSDDVVEVPNPNVQQPRSVPQQAQDSNQGPQIPRPNLTPQQLATMDPENRKKYEHALRMAQMNQANQPPRMQAGDQGRLKAILKEEQENFRELPDIPMDDETKAKLGQALLNNVAPMANVSRALPRWFQLTLDEDQARKFFRARLRFSKQFKADIGQPNPALKDTFSITAKEVESSRTMLQSMVKELSERFPNMKKPDAAKPQPAPTSQPEPHAAQPAQPPTPLNAANLQQQQQQLNKLHQRSNSRSSHTPAAPTSTQPPFQFGATSPHGAPAYIGKNTLKQEDLHLPAKKKQKQHSTPVPGQSTPGSTSSPKVAKAVSPEVKRQQPESKPQARSNLCCPEPECERHNFGFDNEDALKRHTQDEHIRPLENPLRYVQEGMAPALGLDSQGNAKKPVVPTNQESGSAAMGAKMVTNGSKQGQTPTIKGGSTPSAATPMNRQVSMNRQGSAAGGKPNVQSKTTPAKEAAAKPQPAPKDSAKQQESQAPQEPAPFDPWANATIDPHDLFQSFQPFETGAGGAISDMNVYRSITPNDTPESSKDGVSEPNSDISEGVGLDISLDIFDDKWMPFGASDTEGLFDINSFNVNGEEDLLMFDDQPVVNYQSWDDMVDPSALDKTFSFDTSFYSMNAD